MAVGKVFPGEYTISRRDMDLLASVCAGDKGYKEAANELHCSYATAKNRGYRILRILGKKSMHGACFDYARGRVKIGQVQEGMGPVLSRFVRIDSRERIMPTSESGSHTG